MSRFNGFDIDGNICEVQEYKNDIGIVTVNGTTYHAIRLAQSTYMGDNGRVYAANRDNCYLYTTPEWINWARCQMYSKGILPNF